MVVLVGFSGRHDSLQRFNHVFLVVLGQDRARVYGSPTGFQPLIVRDGCVQHECESFLEVKASAMEEDKILSTCEACCKCNFRYEPLGVWEVFSSLFRPCPPEESLFVAPKLHATQIVILILRECLDPPNAVLEALGALHSRLVVPTFLYDALRECCHYACTARVQAQVRAVSCESGAGASAFLKAPVDASAA